MRNDNIVAHIPLPQDEGSRHIPSLNKKKQTYFS